MSREAGLLLLLFLLWNLSVFLLYGADKRKSKREARRIPEKTLLLAAFFFGGTGAFLGMEVYHHKTQHWYFRVLLPLFALMNIGVMTWILGSLA